MEICTNSAVNVAKCDILMFFFKTANSYILNIESSTKKY